MRRAVIASILALASASCSSYASFIETLNERQLSSCVEAHIVVGSVLTGGNGSIHVYSATGGYAVADCIKELKK